MPGRGGAELEAWSLRKEAAYFREVFRRDFGRGGVERADDAGVEQPLQRGGAAVEIDAGEGAFAQADGRPIRRRWWHQQRAEERW